MKMLVLGAGVVGVTSAWYLARDGHEVLVLDRQPAAGLETSFANGGQISVGHCEPWANPQAPLQVLKWLGREDAPLLFRWRADLQQWLWGLRFLRECLPWRTLRNTERILRLALYSRECLLALRAETGIEYDQLTRGILEIYQDEGEFVAGQKSAARVSALGYPREVKCAAECVALEPALAGAQAQLLGGVFTPQDESGDAHRYTQNLAALAAARGVRFRYGVKVESVVTEAGAVKSLRLLNEEGRKEVLSAEAYVVSLGSYSPLLLRPIGLGLPVYPTKGYSATLPIGEASAAPTLSLTDMSHKIVFSRLGNRLRVAGTAELNGYDQTLNAVRCQALARRAFELFPGVGEPSKVEYWTGLRPATPSNVPCIGRTRFPNLFLNTGHGTLGWTLACGSGQTLADIVAKRKLAAWSEL